MSSRYDKYISIWFFNWRKIEISNRIEIKEYKGKKNKNYRKKYIKSKVFIHLIIRMKSYQLLFGLYLPLNLFFDILFLKLKIKRNILKKKI